MDKYIQILITDSYEKLEETIALLKQKNLHTLEINLRTDSALDLIKHATTNHPDILVGAGTVINLKQCKKALKVGAQFIVSPGLDEKIAKFCKKRKVPYYPGCVTPTEIQKAISLGIQIVKFFPQNTYGGLDAMKRLSGPYPQIKFMPTGGITNKNAHEFLAWDKIVAVGGTCFLND